jgi:hypothetical protein
MTIRVYQHAEETTRSANNSCSWIAETIVNGIVYSVRSRYGAAHELARVLVAAGIPDAVMRVTTAGLRGEMVYRSVHAMAAYTFRENAQTPVRRARWVAPEDATQRDQAAPTPGANAPPGTPVAAQASRAPTTSPPQPELEAR